MLKKEVLSLLGRKGKVLAGQYYKEHERSAMIEKDWFSGGFNKLVTASVNHALLAQGKNLLTETLSSNTANAVGSAIDND